MRPLLEVDEPRQALPDQEGHHVRARRRRGAGGRRRLASTSRKGETLGLVGESGCGKSTLCRTILQLIEPTSGSIKFDGQEIAGLGKRQMRAAPARDADDLPGPLRVAQPAQAGRPDHRRDPIDLHGIATANELAQGGPGAPRARRALGPSTTTAIRTSSREASASGSGSRGPWRCKPKLIIADEPVSALDVSIQAQIINLLEDLQDEFDLTYLFVAHDLGVVRHVADRIAVMYLGKIVEIGPAEEVYSNPVHPYTEALLSAVPIPDPRANAERQERILEGDVPSPANPPPACRFHTRCPYATEICSEVAPELVNHRGSQVAACHHPLNVQTSETQRKGGPKLRGRRIALAAIAATALSLGATACGDDDDDGGGGSSGEADTLIQGTIDQPVSYDPAGSYDLPSYNVIFNTYQNLLQIPPGGNAPEPEAAEECDFTDDENKVYECTLKEGLTFSDGSDLTSEDVKASFDRNAAIADPQGASSLYTNLKSIDTPDDLTVVFNLKASDATWPFLLTSGGAAIVPAEYPADKVQPSDQVIGSGRYTVAEYEPGQQTVLEANPEYHG